MFPAVVLIGDMVLSVLIADAILSTLGAIMSVCVQSI